MKNKNAENVHTRLVVRTEGLSRNDAIVFAEQTYPAFEVYYVMQGPRNEVLS